MVHVCALLDGTANTVLWRVARILAPVMDNVGYQTTRNGNVNVTTAGMVKIAASF